VKPRSDVTCDGVTWAEGEECVAMFCAEGEACNGLLWLGLKARVDLKWDAVE